jgi:SpoVK/Ycf46/Vps4 family AAA+-type ATPase
MASISQLTKLFKAVAAADFSVAEEVATEISHTEEQRGHHTAAQVLRGALRPNTRRNGSDNGVARIVQQAHSTLLSSALTSVETDCSFDDIVLRPLARSEFADLIAEWKNRDELLARQIRRRKKLLFYGPPGCGKSLSAQVLGRTLSLPVFVVRFDAVVGAYLGQTALHLRELFRFAEATPCVLLVDEVDALGKRRGNPLDVGELDRIVITLMQELEHAEPRGYIVATSNLPGHLDEALWRRFDLVLEFPRPNARELSAFAAARARARRVVMSTNLRKSIRAGKSFAEVERSVESEARRLVLAGL